MATPNTLFAVLNVSDPAVVAARMETIAPWLHLNLDAGQWFLIAPSGTTTKEVCERIGIDGLASSGIVVRVDSYYGRNPQSVWEWIATKQGAELGTKAPA